MESLNEGKVIQECAVGPAWQDHNLVFCSKTGTYLDPVNLRGIFERLFKEGKVATYALS